MLSKSQSQNINLSGGQFVALLRQKKKKIQGGLGLMNTAGDDVIAVVESLNTGKVKYICNDANSEEKELFFGESYAIYAHIPRGKERFIVFISGESGLGKTGLTSFMIKQAKALIPKINIFYICGTDIDMDINMKKLKYIIPLDGKILSEINVEKDFVNSLIVVDDIDNWEYHKDAIKLINKCYEVGRKFGINIIYISHNTTKATESKIYDEVDMYITNQAKDNRMMQKYLHLSDEIMNEMEHYLKTDVFVCYNKIFRTVYTDYRIYKI